MKRDEFVGNVADMLKIYIDNSESFDSNPQLRVNPDTLAATIVNGSDMMAEIEHSDENIEAAAGAEGAATEDDTDFQVTLNPDFYTVVRLITDANGKRIPDKKAIEKIADYYYQGK